MDHQNPAAVIHAMARQHKVAYVQTETDVLAGHITRLAGDDMRLDVTQLLLLALRRAGHISGYDAMRLQAAYLRQVTVSRLPTGPQEAQVLIEPGPSRTTRRPTAASSSTSFSLPQQS